MTFLRAFGSSVSHAWRGLLLAFRTERSFRIQVALSLVALTACFLFPIRSWERIAVILATASVLVLELVNSMIERLVDLVKPRLHEYARDIKDLMAAAVLVAALFALLVACLVFGPFIVSFLTQI